MDKSNNKVSIVLYGNVVNTSSYWHEWYLFAKQIIHDLGYTSNYLGVKGESFKSGKYLTIGRTENRLIRAIESKEKIDYITVLSLPDNFKQAVFDYYIELSRICCKDRKSIFVSMDESVYERLSENVDDFIEQLKIHIDFECGQLFQLQRKESAFFYAMKANSPSYYKSLKIIKDF